MKIVLLTIATLLNIATIAINVCTLRNLNKKERELKKKN